jgi:7-cyano-7-deazaguanine synthase in queuosine biosynthesis
MATDLLEIAALVYTADQAVGRGGVKEFEYGQKWRRHFRFEFAVRRPERWRRPEVSSALGELLSFLSDDDYEFGFSAHPSPPPAQGYFRSLEHDTNPEGIEEVILLSGGLDSLGGAVTEILQSRRKVALVSHRSSGKIYARQTDVVQALTDVLPDQRLRPLHVAVEVNKGKRLNRDFMQRTRSFLFGTLAALVAHLLGKQRVRFYENGVTSLNLPISPHVLGGRASRTTHPQTLRGMEKLFGLIFDQQFTVENPFEWYTKTQVLQLIRSAGCGTLCAKTSSCVKTWTRTLQHPHCGCGSQCVERRVSALAAGLDEKEDPSAGYESDVVTGARTGPDLTWVERYHGIAVAAEKLTEPQQLLIAHPEVARVLRHTKLPAARAAELALDLHRRHARDVCQVLVTVLHQQAENIVYRRSLPNSMLGVAFPQGDRGPTPPALEEAPAARNAPDRELVLDADKFEVRWAGKACFLGNTLEFRLLVRLRQRPGAFVSVNSLRLDVWRDDHTEKYTIQRTVSNLRRRLAGAGMGQIHLDGSQRDHYQLVVPK